MIKLDQISKRYGNSIALNNVSTVIEKESTTVFIGPSGCGKSTTIKLINGLVKPDNGTVLIYNKPIESYNIYKLRRKIGYVIQDGGLFPHLTVKENLSLMPKFVRMDHAEIEEKIVNLCNLTKFPKDALFRYPVQISGGQKQRVSLMRCLMLDPDILLLDEPMGSLDPMIRFDLQGDLKDIFEELGKTVVLVTHDIGEASFLADKIVLMKQGEIVQQGNLNEFIKSPINSFVTQFINAQRIYKN